MIPPIIHLPTIILLPPMICFFYREEILRRAARVTPNVALFMPRNTPIEPLVEFAKQLGQPRVEIEENYLNKSKKALTIYYSDLVSQ